MITMKTKNHKLGKTIELQLNIFKMGSITMGVYQNKRRNHTYTCRRISDIDTIYSWR